MGIPIGFGSLVRSVRRYSLLVFVFVLLAIAAGALVYFFLPLPRMTAQMIFFVNQNPPSVLTPGMWNERDPATYRTYLANVFKNRLLLNDVLMQPGITGLPVFEQDKNIEPLEYLRTQLRIDYTLGPEHMRISIEGNESAEILAIMNAVKTSYIKKIISEEHSSHSQSLERMQNLHRKYAADLKNFRIKVRNVLSVGGSTDTISQEWALRFITSQAAYIEGETTRLNARERELTLQLKRIEEELKIPRQLRNALPKELVEQFVQSDPSLGKLRKELDSINGQLQSYEGVLKPNAPKPPGVVLLEGKKIDTEIAIRDRESKLRPELTTRLNEELVKGEANLLKSVQSQIDMVRDQKQQVESEFKKEIEKLKAIKEQNALVEDLKADILNVEQILTTINGKIVSMQPELEAAPRVWVWDEPYTFYGIEGNRRIKYTAMAVIGFLVLGLILAQWLELRHRRIQTLEEITHGLGLQVLGTVPAMPKGGVNAGSNWPHLLTEAVNTTRTMLLSGPNSHNNKTLLVTSAMSGEGKTSLTTHLAVSLANAGRKVMIIDADMRRPAVHRVLGLTSKPGLAELLIGTNQLQDVVQTCKIPNLHLVPAGSWSREAAAALSSESWPRILHEASNGFDFVLVDSPPILPVADALAIARNVDGVLISVMQDQSRYGAVQTACQRLNMVGAKVLGVVVSGMKSVGGYYYYYYYDERYSKPNANTASADATAQATTEATPPAAAT